MLPGPFHVSWKRKVEGLTATRRVLLCYVLSDGTYDHGGWKTVSCVVIGSDDGIARWFTEERIAPAVRERIVREALEHARGEHSEPFGPPTSGGFAVEITP